jgi:hypothetical protein
MNSTSDMKPQMQATIAMAGHAPPSVMLTATTMPTQSASARSCPSQFSIHTRVLP